MKNKLQSYLLRTWVKIARENASFKVKNRPQSCNYDKCLMCKITIFENANKGPELGLVNSSALNKRP